MKNEEDAILHLQFAGFSFSKSDGDGSRQIGQLPTALCEPALTTPTAVDDETNILCVSLGFF